MISVCIDEITNSYNTFNESTTNNLNSSEFCQEMSNELTRYSEAIKNFFTGKETEIKFIYKSIRENSFPYNKVKCYDINSAIHQYMEYYPGLVEFINKLIDLRDTDTVDPSSAQSTIAQVNNRDKEFICSIVNGDKNELEEVSINDAMKNVESLIEINNSLNDFKKMVESTCRIIDNNHCDKYQNEIKQGLRVFVTSIACFNSKVISEVANTYDKIHQSIQQRVPVNPPAETPTYQMF